MRDLLLILALAAASVSHVLPNDINKPTALDFKHIPNLLVYNLVSPQNTENRPSTSNIEYASLSLFNSLASPALLNYKNKRLTPEHKRAIPSSYNSVSTTPIVQLSERKFVYNSVTTNSNEQITTNTSKPSLLQSDVASAEASGDGFVSILDTVTSVLGDSLSLWNNSAGFYDGKSIDEAFDLLAEGLALIEGTSNVSVLFALWPGVAVKMEPGINGSVSFGIKSDEKTTQARGTSLRKRFTRIFPFMLVPPLIMSAILPFVLPAMKLMAVAAGALNQMALVGAVLAIMRDHAFSDTPKKKLIYVNEGYENDRPHHHDGENSHGNELHLDDDLKKYEKTYHGSHPQSLFEDRAHGLEHPERLEFAASDHNAYRGDVESRYEGPVYPSITYNY